MKKRVLVICFSLMILLTSCERGETHTLQEIEQDTLIFNQITEKLLYDDVALAISQKVDMYTFCKMFDISQYKSVNNIYYTVISTTDDQYLMLFDNNGLNPTMQQIKFSSLNNKESFSHIKVGMTLENAKVADPEGNYIFLFHSWKNYPQFSYHFFEDGECFYVRYEENTVVEIINFTI